MVKYEPDVLGGIYQRVVNSMSGIADVSVEIVEGINPHFEPKSKTIRMPNLVTYAENDEDDFHMGRGICIHEAAHLVFMPECGSTAKYIEMTGKCSKDFYEWMNVFGDVNNEQKAIELWPHFKGPLSDKTMRFVDKHLDILETDNPFMQVLLRIDPLITKQAKFPDGFNKELKDFVETIVKKFKKKKIKLATGKDLLRFGQDVFDEWAKIAGNINRGINLNALNGLKEKLGKAIISGDSKAENDLNKKIDGMGDNWFKDDIERLIIRHANGGNNLSDESIKKLKELIKKSKHQTKTSGNGYLPPLTDTIEQVRDYGGDVSNDIIDINRLYREGKQINRALRKKINLQQDFEKRHRSGDIDLVEVRNQISKAGMIYKPTIFQRDNNFQRGGEWALSILVDCSGSMGGERMDNAKQALTTLAYALNGLPNVHYEMIGYDSQNVNKEYVVKSYRDKNAKIDKIKKLKASGGTPTHTVMASSLRRILKFKNIKKVMIVITDGMSSPTMVQEVASECKFRDVAVLGIGIGINKQMMDQQFPEHMEFEVNDDLDKKITTLILNALGQKKKNSVKKIYKY